MRRLATIGIALCLATGFVAGCGSDDDAGNGAEDAGGQQGSSGGSGTNDSTGGGTSSAGTTIKMKDIEYVPKEATVKAGSTVKWENTDSVAHTVTADNGEFDSGTMQPGDDFEFKVAKAGTLGYTCTIHPNQKGQLTVG